MKLRKHILILDDDVDMITFLSKILENAGHSTHYATNENDFEKKLKEIGPHLLLIDYKLGNDTTNGVHIIQRLKNDPHYKIIPIFLISSALNKQVITMATQLGAEEAISKPIQTNVFLQKVKKTLKIHELPEIEFSNPKDITCISEADIAQISEIAVKIKTPIKFAEETSLDIESTFLDNLGCKACRYKIDMPVKVLEPGVYINQVKMKGVKDETAKKIRMIKAVTKS